MCVVHILFHGTIPYSVECITRKNVSLNAHSVPLSLLLPFVCHSLINIDVCYPILVSNSNIVAESSPHLYLSQSQSILTSNSMRPMQNEWFFFCINEKKNSHTSEFLHHHNSQYNNSHRNGSSKTSTHTHTHEDAQIVEAYTYAICTKRYV